MSKLVNALERIWNWRKVNYNNPEDGLLHPGFTRKQIENMFQGLPFIFQRKYTSFSNTSKQIESSLYLLLI